MIRARSRKEKVERRWNACIWECDLAALPRWQRLPVRALRLLHAVLRDLAEGQFGLQATSLVYTTVISLVPLLALCFSVLKGFGVHNAARPALLSALEPLGEKRFEIVERVIGFVDNVQVGVLGALGLAVLLYSVIAMMQKIERAFNHIWCIVRGRSFMRRLRDYVSVLLLGPLLIFLSAGITASVRGNAAAEWFAAMPGLGAVLEWIGLAVPYFIMAAAFAFIYMFMPNTRVRFGPAFAGGLVTAVIWKTMGWLFALFVAGSGSHTAIYSAFASIIVFLVWLYVGWLVLLVGASVAYYIQNPDRMRQGRMPVRLSNRFREKLALSLAYLVAKRYHEDGEPWSAAALARTLNLPSDLVEAELALLASHGFVAVGQGGNPAYYLAHAPERIRPLAIVQAVRADGETAALNTERLRAGQPVERLLREMETSLRDRAGRITLKQLLKR